MIRKCESRISHLCFKFIRKETIFIGMILFMGYMTSRHNLSNFLEENLHIHCVLLLSERKFKIRSIGKYLFFFKNFK